MGIEEDRERQEEMRKKYQEQFLQDRARQNLVKGGSVGTNAGTIGREAGKLADKETFDKFKAVLGKDDAKFKTTDRSVGIWMLALGLAIAKDLLDMSTMEMLSGFDWIVDLIFGVCFYILLGTSVRKGARFLKSIGPTILEAIPVLGFLPFWSMTVAYLYFKSQQEE